MSIKNFICRLASPKYCYEMCQFFQPWAMCAFLVFLAYGLVDGLLFSPADHQQGDAFRIIYVHAPAAMMSLFIYSTMALFSFIYLVWKIKTADIIAKVSAPLGLLFTALTLITGSLWGKPMWGTFWIWDARLTSELILLFIYFGIIALRASIPLPKLAARATSLMTLMGAINIPIVHYSVYWWHTLHQGATLLKLSRPSIATPMLWPLLAMIMAFLFYYIWVLLIKIDSELLLREKDTAWVRALSEEN